MKRKIQTEILHNKLMAAGAALLKECLLDYIEGRITPVPQDETQVQLRLEYHERTGAD